MTMPQLFSWRWWLPLAGLIVLSLWQALSWSAAGTEFELTQAEWRECQSLGEKIRAAQGAAPLAVFRGRSGAFDEFLQAAAAKAGLANAALQQSTTDNGGGINAANRATLATELELSGVTLRELLTLAVELDQPQRGVTVTGWELRPAAQSASTGESRWSARITLTRLAESPISPVRSST